MTLEVGLFDALSSLKNLLLNNCGLTRLEAGSLSIAETTERLQECNLDKVLAMAKDRVVVERASLRRSSVLQRGERGSVFGGNRGSVFGWMGSLKTLGFEKTGTWKV